LNNHFSYKKAVVLFLLCLGFTRYANSQATDSTKPFIPVDSLPKLDSPVVKNKISVDSVIKYHSPKKAAIRSAIVPGLGQIYNKKYWKLPIVYGALGTAGAIFVFNISSYRELRFAYAAKYKASLPGATAADSSDFRSLDRRYQVLDVNSLRSYRDEYRRNVDYSVLAFILLWGLNVVDATVDAHLKAFDVSPDLSFKIKVGHSAIAGTNGISLVLALK
jgi:hypothetical protein